MIYCTKFGYNPTTHTLDKFHEVKQGEVFENVPTYKNNCNFELIDKYEK